jgi:lysophospholipase L1-like esterase
MGVLYVVDQGMPGFEADRLAVDVVCAGDSLTGWNNFGPASIWPYRTYPDFLQELIRPLRVANGGIAGEVSDNGPQQVRDYLGPFPNARYFIIGFGTNDLGTWPDLEATSRRIIANLDQMVRAVVEPHANEAMFSPWMARELHEKRDYHNARLKEYCEQQQIPLADICTRLRDEHFGDELHLNDDGAKIIAEEVHKALIAVRNHQ